MWRGQESSGGRRAGKEPEEGHLAEQAVQGLEPAPGLAGRSNDAQKETRPLINFTEICLRCNRLSPVNLEMPCPNTFGNGRVCGYALTTDVVSGNHTYRAKEAKPTNPPPPSGSTGDHPWTR